MPPKLFVDARALQDPAFAWRGIGSHIASLLTGLRLEAADGMPEQIVGLLERRVARPDRAHLCLFDEIQDFSTDENVALRIPRESWVLLASPMTHNLLPFASILRRPDLFSIALAYDYIPLAEPARYLATAQQRAQYLSCLAWLRHADAFASISHHTSEETMRRAAIDPAKGFVTGVAIRDALRPTDPPAPARAWRDRSAIVVPSGDDERKNTALVLEAVAGSLGLTRRDVIIQVVGNVSPQTRSDLRALFHRRGGRLETLTFISSIDDGALGRVYANCLMVVAPSRAEGFSIPVIEAMAAGVPVLASSIPAHRELITDPRALFAPDSAADLRSKMEDVALKESAWAGLLDDQAGLWREFEAPRVTRRFIEGCLRVSGARPTAPAVLRMALPKIAVLSPLPPSQSGVADYSFATLAPLAAAVTVDFFTETPGGRAPPGRGNIMPLQMYSLVQRSYDAVLGVMGNSHFHSEIFELILATGIPSICHDSRLSDFYWHCRGPERMLALASAETGRVVSASEAMDWLTDPACCPILFLSELLQASRLVFMHSRITAELAEQNYGVTPRVLPFAQYRCFTLDGDERERRAQARARAGLDPDRIVIATFGHVGHDRRARELVWALRVLHDWGVEAHLHFVGSCPPGRQVELTSLGRELKIEDSLFIGEQPTGERRYRDMLSSCDAAVQLRSYKFGGLSGALNDCIAAAVPTVANEHLAVSMEAPSFVKRVPDVTSPVLVAEALLEILTKGKDRPIEEALAFATDHSPRTYCTQLLNEIGLDPGALRS